jgi:hypothetical protein
MHYYNDSNSNDAPGYGYNNHHPFFTDNTPQPDLPDSVMGSLASDHSAMGNVQTPVDVDSSHTQQPGLPNTVMGTLGSDHSSVGNVQTPVNFDPSHLPEGLSVTGVHKDPQTHKIHLFTGHQLHLFKAYNTSEISLKMKDKVKQILSNDMAANAGRQDMCKSKFCRGIQLSDGVGVGHETISSPHDTRPSADNSIEEHEQSPLEASDVGDEPSAESLHNNVEDQETMSMHGHDNNNLINNNTADSNQIEDMDYSVLHKCNNENEESSDC